MVDSRVSVDRLQTKQLPETIRDVYRGFAHGVACATARFNGRGDLNTIQVILTARGRRGRVVEEVPGRSNLIRRGDYGNAERYRIQVTPPVDSRRRGCHSHSMSKTAIDISNRFRKLFGLEPIDPPNLIPVESMESNPTPPVGEEGMHIMPFPPIPVENVSSQPVHRHSHHRHHRLQKASFIERLSHALMLLGPWEGRAVAFVLGCGIGVILRMIYILALVTSRMFRGSTQLIEDDEDDEDEQETAVLLVAPPPEYIRDEKAGL